VGEVVPPRLVTMRVEYPEGATGTARVLLELVVERDGSVRSVRVLFGLVPFAHAAEEAALGFHFEPARRGGQPVPARIRLEVEYSPPEAPPPTPVPGVAAASTHAATAPVARVQVLGEATPGAVGLSQAEARVLPGAFGDPFRAISVLPGVAPLVTGLPVYYVRGAPPGNLGFYIDGVRVPLLFHAFLGPAVIHPRLMERTDLYAGGYPARFGRFAGGIINAEVSEPRGEFNGEWSARLIDAGLFVDAPFAGGKGNVLLSGRYSYTALLLSMLSDLKLDYWDYQALVSYDFTPRDRLSIFAFGAYDFAGAQSTPSASGPVGEGDSAVLFHRIDVRYDRRFGDSTKLRAAGTVGLDVTRGGQGQVRDRMTSARLELESQLSARVMLRAGASGGFDRYELELDPNTENFLDVVELFPTRWDSVVGGYAELVIEAAPGISVTPGLRVDRYASMGNSALGVSPRLAATFRLSRAVSIEHTLGLADQPPNFVPGVPGVAVAGLPGGLQRSLQSSAGVRAELPASIRSRVTLFQNAFFSLTDPFSQRQDLDLDADQAKIRAQGHAYGLELSLQRPLTQRIGASLAYTLSRTTRSFGRVGTLSGYDRPHVLNGGVSFDSGRHWLWSAQSVLYSGVPGSRSFGELRVFDQSRAPPFFRVDVRLEKRFIASETAWWSIVFEMMNASLSREVLRRPCERTCRNEYVGPIVLPSLGVSGQF